MLNNFATTVSTPLKWLRPNLASHRVGKSSAMTRAVTVNPDTARRPTAETIGPRLALPPSRRHRSRLEGSGRSLRSGPNCVGLTKRLITTQPVVPLRFVHRGEDALRAGSLSSGRIQCGCLVPAPVAIAAHSGDGIDLPHESETVVGVRISTATDVLGEATHRRSAHRPRSSA